jgi:Right handed beta helix region
LAVAAGILVCGCGGGGGDSGGESISLPNPAPTLNSLSPASATAAGAAFTLTLHGTNFITGSQVRWNGSALITTYVSATQLTAAVTASSIATAGIANVAVANPTPGGGTSSALSFTIDNPIPAVSSLSPPSGTVGGTGITLTVKGSNFVSSSMVQWNGSNRPTTFASPTQLTASITAADIAFPGTANITVVNSAPGGGASSAVRFAYINGVPSISSPAPTTVNADGVAFTLTVNGANFTSASQIQWNGSSRATTYVSATQLTVAITSADIALPGTAVLTISNPSPGGGTSSASKVGITGTMPTNVSFVAPTGNDSSAGSITQPYLTIQKCATTVSSGGTCAIRAGTYRETVTPNSGITVTSYDGETVTVDGSDPVTGWAQYQGSIYMASVALSSGDTNQLFVGSQMMTEARWPNGNDLFHVNWATAQAGTTDVLVVDQNLPKIDWTGTKIHLWSGTDPFSHQTGMVTASSPGQIGINVSQTGTYPSICPTSAGYYYLFGILGALDAENEWFYDSSVDVLYFWAPGGVNPNSLGIRAKQRQYAFDLSGKTNVTIENLGIFAAGITSDGSSQNNIIDGISAQYVSHFTTLPPAPGDTSGVSILSVHQFDTGIVFNGSGNILRNSTIAYSAGSGVVISGQNNTVTNNLIEYIDYIGNYSSGVVLASGSTIQSNTIQSVARQAIVIEAATSLNNIEIGYNNLFNAMMLSRDGAEVYACCSFSFVTSVDHNWIHDTQSLVAGAADNSFVSGVYIDNGTSGFVIEQNVLWNKQHDAIFLNGNGVTTANNNIVENNSFPDANSVDNFSIVLSQIPNCGTTQVIDNLVLVPVDNLSNNPACVISDNGLTAPGAAEMNSSVQVGCNFAGCLSDGPPAISGSSVAASIATQPYSMTVAAGQTATFSVTGAGTGPLSYQWLRDGVDLSGATGSTYTTPATAPADNGTVFSVRVSNSLAEVTSHPATLNVD